MRMLKFAAAAVLASGVAAKVAVELKAQWQSDFLLELVETLSTKETYFDLVNHVAEQIEDGAEHSDQEWYDKLSEFVSQGETQKSLTDGALALRRQSPLIETMYQLADGEKSDCDMFFTYNGEKYCDTNDLFTLKTTKSPKNPKLYFFDHVARSSKDSKTPVAILYANIRSPNFPLFHKILYQEAADGKLVYVLRYKRGEKSENVTMTGYGAELSLKKTDYLVIDEKDAKDRVTDKDGNPALGTSFTKHELQNMGLNAASYVLHLREDPKAAFDALKNVSFNFPAMAASLNETKLVDGYVQALSENHYQAGFTEGGNEVYVNGAVLSSSASNIQSLLDLVELEYTRLEKLSKASDGVLTVEQSSELINNYPLVHALESQPERIDYRDENAILWLNDLTTDAQYKDWPRSVSGLLQQMLNTAHNYQTIVIPFNMDDFVDVKMEGNQLSNLHPSNRGKITLLITLLQQKTPVQFGVVPYGTTSKGKKLARYMHYLAKEENPTHAMRLLFAVGAGTPQHELFNQIPVTKRDVDSAIKLNQDEYKEYNDACLDWMKRLALNVVQIQDPAFVMNGVVLPFSDNWQTLFGAQFRQGLMDIQGLIQRHAIRISAIENPDGTKDYEDIEADPVERFFRENEIKDLLVAGNSKKRNLILSPVTFSSLKYVDPEKSTSLESVGSRVTVSSENAQVFSNSILAGNFGSLQFVEQLLSLLEGQQKLVQRFAFRTQIVHLGQAESAKSQIINGVVQNLDGLTHGERISLLKEAVKFLEGKNPKFGKKVSFEAPSEGIKYLSSFKVTEGSVLFVLDGLVNFLSSETLLNQKEVVSLYEREATRRLARVSSAFKDLKLEGDGLDLAKIHVHLAQVFYGAATQRESSLFDVRTFHHAHWVQNPASFLIGDDTKSIVKIISAVDIVSDKGQQLVSLLEAVSKVRGVSVRIFPSPKAPNPREEEPTLPLKRFYRSHNSVVPEFDSKGKLTTPSLEFEGLPHSNLLTFGLDTPSTWIAMPADNKHDLDNIILSEDKSEIIHASYSLQNILIEGSILDTTLDNYAVGTDLLLKNLFTQEASDTLVMSNLGYFQLQANPGLWKLNIGPSASEVYETENSDIVIPVTDVLGPHVSLNMERQKGKENVIVGSSQTNKWDKLKQSTGVTTKKHADINIFTVASGHLYERFLSIMTASVMAHTNHTVKFWLIENFLSASFKAFLPHLAAHYGFEYELVTYQWPNWLRGQSEKQRQIWGYKILFLDVLFPQDLDRVIFIDSDQIVRTDLYELVEMDLEGAPYGFTPMCDSRKEMDGFRFWKQGYWKKLLGEDLVYHISALFVVDLNVFRAEHIGDRLRIHYQQLSADPASLSNLDQDLPNNLQRKVPIFSLPQDWLWCETWCSDNALKTAKTIDMCNNPLTKEPKLDRAKRQVPEWTKYDDEIAELRKASDGETFKQQSEVEAANVEQVSESSGTFEGAGTTSQAEDASENLHDEL